MPNFRRPISLLLLLLLSALLICCALADDNSSSSKECINDEDMGSESNCTATAGMDNNIDNDKVKADSLLRTGIRALTEEKDSQKANSIFDKIALDYPNYERMHDVQKFNGIALSNLGHGSKALWCFKNAMLLANEYPGKQMLEKEANGNGYQLFVGGTGQIVQSTALQYWNKVTSKGGAVGSNGFPDKSLMYNAISLAYGVGRHENAKVLNDLLLQIDPNHGGARLMAATMTLENADDGTNSKNKKSGLEMMYDALQSYEQYPWDAAMAWGKVGGVECTLKGHGSDGCVDSWLKAFEFATKLTPIDAEIAIKGVTNASNAMFKQQRSLKEVQKLGEKAVQFGVLNEPLQLPAQLIKGVSNSPYRDDARNWKTVQHLEKHYPKIREEILKSYESGKLHKDSKLDDEGLHTAGEWRELNVFAHGLVDQKALTLLPYTAKVVMALVDATSMVLGGTKVSMMEPGTVVRVHTGETNARLRIHLGINIPDGAFIRVNNETRTWTEGKCTVIDDSYVHEVWHHGNQKRIVLIVDVWHLDMELRRREDSIKQPNALEMYRHYKKDMRMTLLNQGVPEDMIPDVFISERDD
eukprot:CAMPEP_0181095132 /NCGR_PEP_ID=MMETSP1071-20121207/10360_1 /TAXON_ID=35127 /ORGANISM="Thalassiosira sp., Strain NH16" /LENGTH=583 /DNA_ID=CAMNT_0023177501 /DNA_START=255 /DNA_END=2006 /DNA_ORIENTATION=-